MEPRDANRDLLVEIVVLWLNLGGLVFVVVGLLSAGSLVYLSYAENGTILDKHYGIALFILLVSSSPAVVISCIGVGLRVASRKV